MSLWVVELPDVVVAIAGGATQSPTQNTKLTHQDAEALIIAAPAGAEASTIQISRDGTTWFALANKATAVAGPAAGNAEVYGLGCPNPPIADFFWRLAFAGPVVAQRTYKVSKIMSHAD